MKKLLIMALLIATSIAANRTFGKTEGPIDIKYKDCLDECKKDVQIENDLKVRKKKKTICQLTCREIRLNDKLENGELSGKDYLMRMSNVNKNRLDLKEIDEKTYEQAQKGIIDKWIITKDPSPEEIRNVLETMREQGKLSENTTTKMKIHIKIKNLTSDDIKNLTSNDIKKMIEQQPTDTVDMLRESVGLEKIDRLKPKKWRDDGAITETQYRAIIGHGF